MAIDVALTVYNYNCRYCNAAAAAAAADDDDATAAATMLEFCLTGHFLQN